MSENKLRLPTFVESENAVDKGKANPLHEFIYNNEPGDDCGGIEFRKVLPRIAREDLLMPVTSIQEDARTMMELWNY